MKERHASSGFTLLEVLVVLVLIVLILGLAGNFTARALGSSRFDTYIRDITTLMRHARTTARATGETIVITLDLDNHSYGIEGCAMRPIPAGIEVTAMDELSNAVTRGSYRLAFDAGGFPDEAEILIRTGTKHAVIRTDPITGFQVTRQ
jgi:general secretion pathway protein H